VRRLFTIVASCLWTACAAPADPPAPVCRDPTTRMCVPCPGTSGCVDPIRCVWVPCADAAFGLFDAAADAGAIDGAGNDADLVDAGGQADATTGELDALVDATPDSAVGDDGGSRLVDALCSDGAKRCHDGLPQTCVVGKWVGGPSCAADLQCTNGICGCKDPCPALNLASCVLGVPAVKLCQLTGSGCLSWGLPVACKAGESCQLGACGPPSQCAPACPPGKVCQGQQCVDAPCQPPCPAGQSCQSGVCVPKGGGTLTCAQVAACIGTCPGGDASCPDACKAQGSDAALGLLAAYQGCLKAVCKPFADAGKINETLLCAYSYCFAEQKACTGAGSGSCQQLSDCLSGCGGSPTCGNLCHGQASQQGGLDYYGLFTCIDNLCAGLQGAAQLACAQQACQTAWNSCFGGKGPVYTTCLQIAQCQGKCAGDIACAKACKAAGTPAAQAAVDAFVACRDGKCGGWCSNPSAPNCMPCVQQYCAAEFAACSI